MAPCAYRASRRDAGDVAPTRATRYVRISPENRRARAREQQRRNGRALRRVEETRKILPSRVARLSDVEYRETPRRVSLSGFRDARAGCCCKKGASETDVGTYFPGKHSTDRAAAVTLSLFSTRPLLIISRHAGGGCGQYRETRLSLHGCSYYLRY